MVIIEQVLDDLAHAIPFLAVQAGELFVRQREGPGVNGGTPSRRMRKTNESSSSKPPSART